MAMGRVAVSPHGGDGPHRGDVAPNKTRVVVPKLATVRKLKTKCLSGRVLS